MKYQHLMGISDFALQREGTIVCLLSIHFRELLSLFRCQLYQSVHRSHLDHKDRNHQVYHPICLTAQPLNDAVDKNLLAVNE